MLLASDITGRIASGLSSDDLQAVIDEQEAWLERRIGRLEGERTETFVDVATDAVLRLRRPTDAVTVTDAGDALTDIALRWNGTRVIRTDGSWVGDIVVSYVPNDELEVRAVLIELVRLAAAEDGSGTGAYQSEDIGDYSYTLADGGVHATRERLVRRLLPRPEPFSLRVRSSVFAS